MNVIKCVFGGGHDYSEDIVAGGYQLGDKQAKNLGYDKGTIYSRKCSRCNHLVLDYREDVDYVALSRSGYKTASA